MDIRKKQRAVVEALEDIKASDIVVLDTARLPSIFERVIIASGESNRQLRALADSVVKKMKSMGAHVGGIEGGNDSDWVLVDLGEIVVHVMNPNVRSHYNLEEIWGGKPVKLTALEAPAPVSMAPSAEPAAAAPKKPSAALKKPSAAKKKPAAAKKNPAAPRKKAPAARGGTTAARGRAAAQRKKAAAARKPRRT